MRGALLLLLFAAEAQAEPFEASGFIGLGVFTSNTALGNSWAPEQVPNTAPVLGARVGWLALPHLTGGDRHLELLVEAELSIATSFTGGSSFEGDRSRMSYFAPVFGWRAHGLLRLAGLRSFAPHLAIGAGGETVASSSPFMSKETDPVVYWGPGASIAISDRWRVRIDLRHGVMQGRDGLTSTFETQLGLSTGFGLPTRRVRVTAPPPVQEPPSDVDTDGDGIPDRLDKCPNERETVNGIEDADGCPEADPDGDGILGDADKCPTAAEDFDGYQDADGCPELDNDGDGIEDTKDACPNEPETKNGYQDADGCPDQIPDDLTRGLATGGTLVFEPNRARVTPAARKLLAPLLAALVAHPGVRITITAHAGKGADGDLVKRRAEAVKWYLVDQGLTEGRIWTALGDPADQPRIDLALRSQ